MTSWRETVIQPRALGVVADAYYEWTRATRFAYYGRKQWVPLLIELTPGTTAQDFAALVLDTHKKKKQNRPAWTKRVRVPPFYSRRPPRFAKPAQFIAVLARPKFIADVYAGLDPSDLIKRFELGQSVEPATAVPLPWAAPPPLRPRGDKPPAVVIGVIDDGIAFAHDRFLSTDGTTRVEYFWDQLTATGSSNLLPEWDYGLEFEKRDPANGIDRRMADSRYGKRVDEDDLYRLSGHIDQTKPGHKSLARRAAHGTHVLDVAANGANRPAPGTRPIVAVQLPSVTTADTSGAGLGPQVYNGLAYIVNRAELIAKAAGTGQLPVVVNISYGITSGPHDGSSVLEAAIDEMLELANPADEKGDPITAPFRVLLPAGNSYLSRCHAWFSLDSGESRDLDWRVLPDDWTESHAEIWLPEKTASKIAITVTAPDGDSTNAFFGGTTQQFVVGDKVVGQASYYPAGTAGRRALVQLSLAPTGWPDGGIELAPAGLWRINVHNLNKRPARDIHGWIKRDDTAPGYPRRGRQSHFDDPLHRQYDDGGRPVENDDDPATAASYIKRRGTVNGIATGHQPIVIGGMRRSDWTAARYTGSGPVSHHPPGRTLRTPDGPDALSVSDDTSSHGGILAAGARSGACVAMHGTSVAAPTVAQWIAEELANGGAGDRDAVIDHAQALVAAPQYTELNPPRGAAAKPTRERGGAGRMEFPPRLQRFERDP